MTVCFFPKRLSATRFDWAASLSYDSLVSRIKLVAQQLGLPVDDYSGHSLRAGGATDLFIGRVPNLLKKWVGGPAMRRWYTTDMTRMSSVKSRRPSNS